MARDADGIKNDFERSAASYDLRWAHYNLGSQGREAWRGEDCCG